MNFIKKLVIQKSSSFLILCIRAYQYFISPLIGPKCKYLPTCSEYGIESLREHGLLGLLYTCKRLCSCHPFSSGGYDPVPKKTVLRKHI